MTLSDQTTLVSMTFKHGEIDEEVLLKLAHTMKKYQIPQVKISGARGFVLAGVKLADVEAVRSELSLPTPLTSKPKTKLIIQACSGGKNCVQGIKNSEELANRIEQMLDEIPLPQKIKIAVSGCANCCAKSMVRDLGFIAQPNGWTVVAGGMTGGVKPRVANIFAVGLDEEQALKLAKRILETHAKVTERRERISQTIERIGFNNFKQLI